MTTKRSLKNDLEQLKETNSNGNDPIIMHLTHFDHDGSWPNRDESPHPELTVQPYPEFKPKSLKIAVPNLIPEAHLQGRFLSIQTCDTPSKHSPTEGDDGVVFACELWDALSDDDLEQEKEIRQENDDPMPPLFEDPPTTLPHK